MSLVVELTWSGDFCVFTSGRTRVCSFKLLVIKLVCCLLWKGDVDDEVLMGELDEMELFGGSGGGGLLLLLPFWLLLLLLLDNSSVLLVIAKSSSDVSIRLGLLLPTAGGVHISCLGTCCTR